MSSLIYHCTFCPPFDPPTDCVSFLVFFPFPPATVFLVSLHPYCKKKKTFTHRIFTNPSSSPHDFLCPFACYPSSFIPHPTLLSFSVSNTLPLADVRLRVRAEYSEHESALRGGVSSDKQQPLERQFELFSRASMLLRTRDLGSIVCDIKFSELSNLDAFWADYLSGALLEALKGVFITDSLKRAAGQEGVRLLVSVDQDDYEEGRKLLLRSQTHNETNWGTQSLPWEMSVSLGTFNYDGWRRCFAFLFHCPLSVGDPGKESLLEESGLNWAAVLLDTDCFWRKNDSWVFRS